MKMQNIRIEAQMVRHTFILWGTERTREEPRFCYKGKKKVVFYNVIADSERFGKNEIMFQGDFESCVAYLEREGYDYRAVVLEQNRGKDIQITNRMFRIIGQDGMVCHLEGRFGDEVELNTSDMVPVAPYTFRLPENPFRSCKGTASVKFGPARAW